MSSGRSDYWYGMLPGRAAVGSGQSEWFASEAISKGTGLSAFMIDYTVPANYKLNVTNGIISCTHPGIQEVVLYLGITNIGGIMMDQIIQLPMGVSGNYILEAGEMLRVYVRNLDSVTVGYYVILFGFEEYMIV